MKTRLFFITPPQFFNGKKWAVLLLCYFVNCLVLQAQQSKSTVQVLSKQKVLLDSFSIRSNQPITQLHSQVYVDYEKGNPKTFWKNLAFFTGSMALGSQLGQQLALPQATENFSNSVQKSLLFPSISLAFIPNIWHNRPRGVPDVNLRITHLNQQGIVLNTWEKTLTQEAKKGPTLLDIKLDTTLTSGKIEVSLENNSKRKVAYWASEVTPTRLDSIKPTTPTTYEPFVISRVSVRRDKLAVLPEQEVVSKINIQKKTIQNFPSIGSAQRLELPQLVKEKHPISQVHNNYIYFDCENGQVFNTGTQKCEGNSYCQARGGSAPADGSGGCDCPYGLEWDSQVRYCVIQQVNFHGCPYGMEMALQPNGDSKCECENGGIFDDYKRECVPFDAITECEARGGYYNDTYGECETDPKWICENTTTGSWEEETQTCLTMEEKCAKDGGVMSYNYGVAECIFSCPAGYERNEYGECVESIAACYSKGGEWDFINQTCSYEKAKQNCNAGINTIWSDEIKKCVLNLEVKVRPESFNTQLNSTILQQIFPSITGEQINKYVDLINAFLDQFHLNCIERIMFFATIGHESGDLRYLIEQPNGYASSGSPYKGRGLMQLTGSLNYSRFQTYLQELGYEDIDFVNNPETLEDPTWEVLSAFWFWETNHIGNYAKELTVDDFFKVSKLVNCGSINANCDENHIPEPCYTCEPVGWPDRLERFNRLKELFPCN